MPDLPDRSHSAAANPPVPAESTLRTTPAGTAGPIVASAAPTSAGRYELLGEIARGGMGVVYRARDTNLNRPVAVKLLQERYAPTSLAARRFLDEARITGQLQHPAILPVHEVGTLPDGRPFLAMKLIKGRTLADLLADGPADRGFLIAAFEQVCQAVAYAHTHGVVHRDLKPQNVMVGSHGEVQVMDWGLAKFRSDARTDSPETTAASTFYDPRSDTEDDLSTRTGSFLGTPAYMAPEQAVGAVRDIDERTDVFGLGAVLCAVLTGKPPFVADTGDATRQLAARGKVDDAFARLDTCGADPELVALCKRCLAVDKASRPADAGEVAGVVRRLRADAEERARQAELDRAKAEVQAAEQRKRRRVQLALAAAVGLLLLGGGAVTWWEDKEAGQRRAERVRIDSEHTAERAATDARARQAVESAVILAADLRDKFRYSEAALALDQAAALVPADAPVDSRERLFAARHDLALARRLDEIRISRVRSDVRAGAFSVPSAYASAFRDRGVDPTGPDTAAVAAWVAASPIKQHLLNALDDWSWIDTDSIHRERLLSVVRRADPGPWANRIRDPATRAGINVATLNRLSAEVDLETTPPNLIVVMFQFPGLAWAGGPNLLSALTQRYPNNFWVQFEAGFYYYYKEFRPTYAIAYFRAARAVRPDLPLVLDYLGMAYLRDGKPDEAISCFREEIRLDPKNASARASLVLAMKDKGELDGAIDEYQNAIRLDPHNFLAHYTLGYALQTKGDLDLAMVAYRHAARLDPNNPAPHEQLGGMLSIKGDLEKAVAEYKEAARLDPNNHWPFQHIGDILRETGKVDEAAAAYKEAISRDNDFNNRRNRVALEQVERWQGFQKRLPGFLAGKDRPATPFEALAIAEFCQKPFNRQYQIAFLLHRDTYFTAPDKTVPLQEVHAACAAVQLASGNDPSVTLGADEWYYLHTLARRWLAHDLTAHRGYAASTNTATRKIAAAILPVWQAEPDLAPVRDPKLRARLPEAERKEWESLWDDVEAIRRQAAGLPSLAPPPREVKR